MKSDLNLNLSFTEVLKKEALNIGIELNDEVLNKFLKYKELLVEWNEKMNLTAITEDYQIIMKHFIDCLEVVKYIKNGEIIIDVGTGAGFPGIVIAIYFEGKVKITLLDSLNKRLTFLKEVVDCLELKNVEIVHGRAEEMSHEEKFREMYDTAVSRAVANLPILLEYDSGYVKVGGRCLLMKGDNVKEELNNSKKALEILNCKVKKVYTYKYNVEEEEYTRNILEVEKYKNTPQKYPRNYGKIKKNPLI